MSVSDEDEVGDAGGYGDWSDEDNDPAQSLFSDQKLPNSAAAIAHDAKHHNFDLARFRTQVSTALRFCIRVKLTYWAGSRSAMTA